MVEDRRRSPGRGRENKVKITLPFPGYPLVSAEARKYKVEAAWEAKRQGMKPLSGPVSVRIFAYRPAKRGDLDNMLKVALDALKGIAWADDEQIEVIGAARFEDKANPRLEIQVEAGGAEALK